MQLNLAFLDPAQPPSGRPPTSPPQVAWEELDEAARLAALAALAVLARLIARLLTDAPAKETGHERACEDHGSASLASGDRLSAPVERRAGRAQSRIDRAVCARRQSARAGWAEDRILVIDEDLGLSGSSSVARSGFARLTAEVALARVGLVLGLEVSRLARNNADWHRLIDLAGSPTR